MAYEVKETLAKNLIGAFATQCFVQASGFSIFSFAIIYFFIKPIYQVYHYMSRAVVKMETTACGAKVRVELKSGTKLEWNIKDIFKSENER